MNKVFSDAMSYMNAMAEFLGNIDPHRLPNVFLVPPFTILREVCDRADPLLIACASSKNALGACRQLYW